MSVCLCRFLPPLPPLMSSALSLLDDGGRGSPFVPENSTDVQDNIRVCGTRDLPVTDELMNVE